MKESNQFNLRDLKIRKSKIERAEFKATGGADISVENFGRLVKIEADCQQTTWSKEHLGDYIRLLTAFYDQMD